MSAEAAITRRINRIGPPEPVVEQQATGSKSKTLKVKSENQNHRIWARSLAILAF